MRVGVSQVVLMLLVALLGGRRLWAFGIHTTERVLLAPSQPTTARASAQNALLAIEISCTR